MTIITNRRTVMIVLGLLALFFLYLSLTNGKTLGDNPDREISREEPTFEGSLPIEGTGINSQKEAQEGEQFFMEYRLERDRRRAQEIELLQSMYNSPNAANEIRQEAQQKLLEMTNSIDQELTLETLIMAKGYIDAVALVQSGQVTIVVRDGEFSDEDSARIADLVSRTTGVSLAKITIFAKK